MTAWYVDWFNSDEYLAVYKHRDQLEADEFATTIIKNLNLASGCETLDLACGAGRHAIAFAKHGHKVTAVDLSPRLLEVGRESVAGSGLNVEFVRANILTYRPTHAYDLVLNVFTSFGYFENDEDNFGIFRTARASLKQSGIFVFDYFNINYINENFVPYTRQYIGKMVVEQSRSLDEETVSKTILIQSQTGLKAYRESVKLYNADTLVLQLEKAGFEILSLRGNYNGDQFSNITSPRFIALCKSV